ncbi:guanitoxin biosynthesis L-enduracididine beta-hydroxylase GntD [Streptomyces sp. KE1]|uniref:guanitoxin biosynthesis L-enduracididine beta-hydroxylase GntD n=1 Tax=Streptomyces sp. KE1 TaxID=1638939 RepID=UPI00063EA3B1|nr:guanitoxin biosynthesis L-enduracididine beta-hydroxylase GntD [Streptomyces sp. KE1]KLJ01158.1 taurine catabolism dioxygenase TauD [Streptomyces sp. KE1]
MIEETLTQYELSTAEVEQIRDGAARLAVTLGDPTAPGDYDDEHHRFADAGLPPRLRAFLENFRRTESAAGLLIHGFPVDDAVVGPTPDHWEHVVGPGSTTEQEIMVAMCATALGQPFTFSTLQLGRMIQNILPIRGDELRQSGHGSETLLEFHTEDGFHPGRCDYLLLFGIRNDDQVPTIMASVRDVKLSDEDVDALMRPDFQIMPDDEHVRQLRLRHPDHPALAQVEEMQRDPRSVPVLFGDRSRPYLRIDLPFMRCAAGRPGAERALHALMAELQRVQHSVVVEQGSLLVVDNYLAVHGRKPFQVRYDGRDRWLKRMIVSRDLRKAAQAGAGAMSGSGRVLF